MKNYNKLFLVCALSLLVSVKSYAVGQTSEQQSETIKIVYSGDIQGNLLPTKI